jgi:hypothetical protein
VGHGQRLRRAGRDRRVVLRGPPQGAAGNVAVFGILRGGKMNAQKFAD